jgi:hypothetical protein
MRNGEQAPDATTRSSAGSSVFSGAGAGGWPGNDKRRRASISARRASPSRSERASWQSASDSNYSHLQAEGGGDDDDDDEASHYTASATASVDSIDERASVALRQAEALDPDSLSLHTTSQSGLDTRGTSQSGGDTPARFLANSTSSSSQAVPLSLSRSLALSLTHSIYM